MSTPATALVRSASLTHFVDLAARCGVDGRALAAEVGLPPRSLDEPDLKVPAASVGRLLELAAERGHEPAFGLRLAEQRRLSNLGPLGLLVRDEPTLRDALEALVRHIHLHNEALTVGVETGGSVLTLQLVLDGEPGQPQRQATELVMAVTHRVLGLFMGASWRPRAVCFMHRAPESVTAHRRVFGATPLFGQGFNGIVCDAAALDEPNPSADPVMARYAQRLLDQDAGHGATFADRVRGLALLLLPRGHCRVEVLAQHLGLDRRTIARRLATEGSSFSALVDDLRRDLVARYRAEGLPGSQPLAELSARLGFAAPSAFARWHRRQYGAAARQRLGG